MDDIDLAVAQATEGGGQLGLERWLDGGERWLATILDPAGNTIGLVQGVAPDAD